MAAPMAPRSLQRAELKDAAQNAPKACRITSPQNPEWAESQIYVIFG